MLDLRSIARALGGEVSGHQVLAPGPGHSPKDRSLAIRISDTAPDGFLIYSHCNDDWRDCRDYVRSKLGLPAWAPGDDREQQRTIKPQYIDKWDFDMIDLEVEQARHRTEDDLVRIERAQGVWNESGDPRRTVTESYLQSRALDLPGHLAGEVLRFHPRCPWRNENTGRTDFIPCMIAAFRSIDDGIVTAVHRIRLDQPERWPKTERRMLGIVQRAAVQLGAPTSKLAIGEGIETAMAAMQLGVEPVAWALGSAGAISFFPVIDGVTELTVLGEAGAASDRAVKICGRRWRRASRRVFVSRPKRGSDHNDVLMQRRVS
jgi:putative DNA primase/helicase